MRSPLLLLLSHFTSWVSTPILIDLIPPRSLREGGRYEGEGRRGREEEGGGVKDERQVGGQTVIVHVGDKNDLLITSLPSHSLFPPSLPSLPPSLPPLSLA